MVLYQKHKVRQNAKLLRYNSLLYEVVKQNRTNINAEQKKQNIDIFDSKRKIFLSLWICSLLTAAAASCCLTQRPSHEHEEDEDGDLDYESDDDDGLFDNDDGDDDDD